MNILKQNSSASGRIQQNLKQSQSSYNVLKPEFLWILDFSFLNDHLLQPDDSLFTDGCFIFFSQVIHFIQADDSFFDQGICEKITRISKQKIFRKNAQGLAKQLKFTTLGFYRSCPNVIQFDTKLFVFSKGNYSKISDGVGGNGTT